MNLTRRTARMNAVVTAENASVTRDMTMNKGIVPPLYGASNTSRCLSLLSSRLPNFVSLHLFASCELSAPCLEDEAIDPFARRLVRHRRVVLGLEPMRSASSETEITVPSPRGSSSSMSILSLMKACLFFPVGPSISILLLDICRLSSCSLA